MKFVNTVDDEGGLTQSQFLTYLQVLAPFAPYITETIWQNLSSKNTKTSIHTLPFPVFDPAKTIDSEITIGVQINGKVRGEITVSPTESSDNIQAQVFQLDFVQKWMEDKTLVKFIYIAGKIINIVIK